VLRGELRRILPAWCLPEHAAWAVFPGRRLMPAKTRAFIDMLESALGAPDATAGAPLSRGRRPRRSTS
jgi:DNA-binding transcriptional LysR family regulator